MKLSVVIPTYNRKDLVSDAIDSALSFMRNAEHENARYETEIVVVDDASVDSTREHIENRYSAEIRTGTLRFRRSEINVGVTGAKNLGASISKGDWLLFLDSDDLLIQDRADAVFNTLERHRTHPAIFFRCQCMETGELIGPKHAGPMALGLDDYLNRGTPGECLPVVKSSCFQRFPYDPHLRGCEGWAYARIIGEFGPALVHPLVARQYRTSNEDRLSVGRNLRKRAGAIGEYHGRILTQFRKNLTPAVLAKTVLKWMTYRALARMESRH